MDLRTAYQEIRIEFLERNEGGYRFHIHLPTHQFEGFFRVRFKQGEIERAFASVDQFSNNWVQRSAPGDTLDPVKEIGTQLFSALFEGSIGELYRHALDRSLSTGDGVRLRLVMRAKELAALPWEFLYDPARRDFIALSAQISIVREWNERLTEFNKRDPTQEIRALVVQGWQNPQADLPGIREETAVLRNLFERYPGRLQIEAQSSVAQFRDALRKDQYDVIIFLGNAGVVQSKDEPVAQQALFFREGPDYREVRQDELLDAFRCQENLLLVYLSACFTDRLACELAKVAPAVVGMRGVVTDQACAAFTTEFMQKAFEGSWLDTAVIHGRRAIDRSEPGDRGWGMPVFYLSASGGLRLREEEWIEREAIHRPQIVQTEDAVIIGDVRVPRRKVPANEQRHLDELATLLAVHEVNLADVRKQIATFSPATVPQFLQLQLEDAEAKTIELKQQIEHISR